MWDEWDELQDARELAEGALELWMEEEEMREMEWGFVELKSKLLEESNGN